MPSLHAYYLPQFVAESDLAGDVTVVIDLLRASTTICYALARGAEAVIPFLEVDGLLEAAVNESRAEVVLGGERGGQRIEGFDLGNSPAEYEASVVFGRRVLFTTTNGTRALHHARLASRVLIGAAVNRRTVVDAASSAERVHILCAGTGGNVTREDILAAGAIIRELLERQSWETNAWAEAACREWEELSTTAAALGRTINDQFAEELKATPGGKNLIAIGQQADLPICAELDVLDVLPELDKPTGVVRLAVDDSA